MSLPTFEEFQTQASGQRHPLWVDLVADLEAPLSVYWKLAHDETYSFLLESVTGGEQLARYSIIGVRAREVLRSKGGTADPLELIKNKIPRTGTSDPKLPKFFGGAVGILGYDLVRFIERLPVQTEDDLSTDDLAMMLTHAVVVFDHVKQLLRIIVIAEPTRAEYEAAKAEIERIRERISQPLPPMPSAEGEAGEVRSNMDQATFEANVRTAKNYIREGDCIQVVLAQRFQCAAPAHPVAYYRSLRSLNPSPYMFLMRFGDFDAVGASPEILVSLDKRAARVRPIAGTRWRGETPDEDARLAEELLADEKERAEHVMLVDLGRNDLGRVCDYHSVKVRELMAVERYSHVMHIVSDVVGDLRADADAIDLIRATFPAGTVSGAPKVRAMEIIEELEPTRRGLYAGAAGYIGSNGDMDMCIAIRTIFLKDGVAYVQAGAGIVFDSVPEREYEETKNKAQACLKAIAMVHGGGVNGEC